MIKSKTNKINKDLNNNSGFTLIELMITLVVFTIGIMGAMGLAFSNYNNSRDNLDKIIAVNLAREGIELIKNVRDSNWLKAEANELTCGGFCSWNSGFNFTNNYVYIDYDDLDPRSSSDCHSAVSSSACAVLCVDCILYKDTLGYYNHDNQISGTKYNRVIKLEEICVNEAGSDPENNEYKRDISIGCDSGHTQIGLEVASYVEWEDNGTKNVEIAERIYNWRR
jgi:prepilin-type N-terminal cleavage/methylation domain-containing protein